MKFHLALVNLLPRLLEQESNPGLTWELCITHAKSKNQLGEGEGVSELRSQHMIPRVSHTVTRKQNPVRSSLVPGLSKHPKLVLTPYQTQPLPSRNTHKNSSLYCRANYFLKPSRVRTIASNEALHAGPAPYKEAFAEIRVLETKTEEISGFLMLPPTIETAANGLLEISQR